MTFQVDYKQQLQYANEVIEQRNTMLSAQHKEIEELTGERDALFADNQKTTAQFKAALEASQLLRDNMRAERDALQTRLDTGIRMLERIVSEAMKAGKV